jgi:hypothetical protein
MTSQNLLLSDVWWRQACPVRSDALTNALTPDQRCLPHSVVAGRLSIMSGWYGFIRENWNIFTSLTDS